MKIATLPKVGMAERDLSTEAYIYLANCMHGGT